MKPLESVTLNGQTFLAAEEALTLAEKRAVKIDRLSARDGPDCFYCGCVLNDDLTSGQHLTFDHRIPRANKGRNDIWNLRLACFECNGQKGDMTEEEFLATEWVALRRQQVVQEKVRPVL